MTDVGDVAAGPSGRWRRFLLLGTVLLVLLSSVGVWVWNRVTPTAVGVVEEFFDAIAAKDIDRALQHVAGEDGGVPYGETGVFIEPEAVADGWRLLDARPEAGTTDTIRATIGDSTTRVGGSVTVEEIGGEWKVVDPFITAKFEVSALAYLRVNDMVVGLDELRAHDPTNLTLTRMKLLPGLNRFFGDLKGSTTKAPSGQLMLPQGGDLDPVEVAEPELEFDEETAAGVQSGMEKIIDECVELEVPQPRLCPFGVDGFSRGDSYYTDIHDVTWRLKEYPRVRPGEQAGSAMFDAGIHVDIDVPGAITLKAKAVEGSRETELTVDCAFSTAPIRAALTADGKLRVRALPKDFGISAEPFDLNTCDGADDQERR